MSPPGTENDAALSALRSARARIAGAMAGRYARVVAIGDITLRAHQRSAVARVQGLLDRCGGALLADATGLGKTYVALAVAGGYERVLIAAPAALRDSWHAALRRTKVHAAFVSLERLSRRDREAGAERYDLVIVDEAHHVRTPSTQRYASVAALTERARVLLLTATPVQNRRGDLLAQLALFLGEWAYALSDDEAAGYVVRRAGTPAEIPLPALDGPHWITIDVSDDDCLDALLALPPPVPAADEGDGGVLLLYTLARQWASSRAALVAALRRRLARAAALETSLASGHLPTRRGLAAWAYADGAVQLALPELLFPREAMTSDPRGLLESVRGHAASVESLLAALDRQPDPDRARADALRQLHRSNPGARMIAFAQFTETIRRLARLLGREPGVAQLTGRGARVAGGRITRREVLAQFGPGARAVPRAERIELLLATDVLSEGLDLQRASLIVHLDLPWNPARLEQRVGRIRRLGSPHRAVTVYALAPPAAPERLLRLEHRLREKLGAASILVGASRAVLPGRTGSEAPSAPEHASAMSVILERWRESALPDPAGDGTTARRQGNEGDRMLVAAAASGRPGWLSLLDDAGAPLLLCDLGDGPTTRSAVLARAVALADAAPVAPDARSCECALGKLREWWSLRRGAASVGAGATQPPRRQLASRIAAAVDRAPRARRAVVAALAATARELLLLPLGAGAEGSLAALDTSQPDDESWLRALGQFAEARRREAEAVRSHDPPPEMLPVRALILLQPAHTRVRGVPVSGNSARTDARQDGPADDSDSAAARR